MKVKDICKLHPIYFWMSLLLAIASAGLFTNANQVQSLLFDAIKEKNLINFGILAGIQFLWILAGYGFLQFSKYFWKYAVLKYFHQIRQKLADHYFLKAGNNETSNIQNRMTTDLNLLEKNLFYQIRLLAYNFALLFFSIGLLLSYHWLLLLTSLLIVAIQILAPYFFERPLSKAMNNLSKENEHYLKTLGQWLIGLNEIRQYFSGQKFFKVLSDTSQNMEQAYISNDKVNQIFDYVSSLLYLVGDAIMLILTSVLVTQNIIRFGVIFSISNFDSYLFGSIKNIATCWGLIKSVRPLREKMEDSCKKVVTKNQTGKVVTGVQVTNLKVTFSNGQVINYPNFTVKPGTKVLLTGDNGTGKSTLLRVIKGLTHPTSGKISYINHEGKIIKPDLSSIDYLPQEPVIFPATIGENITMFSPQSDHNIKHICNHVKLNQDIDDLPMGLETVISSEKISGGQRQKIVLARSLFNHSTFLLIDEGTSAIDSNAMYSIMQYLTKQNITIVFIAHKVEQRLKNMFDDEIHLENRKKN
ncbi:ABC superfamily ATP binding cassette transporter ATP binding and permease protein (plasmid) [Lactobacillus helsingborgensis]|uniref:ABC transporter ATP-binding protein/permease n=2 Tax=Lactobacillus TaxID=1578 RepID=A0AA47B5R1_9LACO|nr:MULTISPECIES: ABC transporter ATP-binding protein [Lactobacillus]KJY54732.1 ABC superfamily ATP binding cassette transporter ATP binding and permease protein [Lactobacillus melliventris]KJY60569.1 ABC superfamily ATP binding cassette transporter ATP binding and permease protein [Lactobacillus helsingborgensis]UZX30615.1 ABC transporter ATP-binding protein/permease [Lactobacillus helsingborgensis]